MTPKFIRDYAGDLESVTADVEHLEFVHYLQALVSGSPMITGVETLKRDPAPSALVLGRTYALTGAFLNNRGQRTVPAPGQPRAEVAWVGSDGNAVTTGISGLQIEGNIVTFAPTAVSTAARAVGIYFTDSKGQNPKLAVASSRAFTVVKGS